MKNRNTSAVMSITEWLASCRSENTRNTYNREFKRLLTWLLAVQLDFVKIESEDLSRYLTEFAKGRLDLDPSQARPKKQSTVTQAKDVLRRLFENLRREGIRSDNPMNAVPEIAISEATPAAPIASADVRAKWHRSSHSWLNSPAPEFGLRAEDERSNALAVFVYWTALQRSELAKAKMADFELNGERWFIRVNTIRKSAPTKILVSAPAMAAIRRYRISRGLTELPGSNETDVPLFSRKNTERAMDPWTIAHILRADTHQLHGGDQLIQNSISKLRKAFVADGVTIGVSEFEIGQHIRSHYAVRNVASQIGSSIAGDGVAKMQTTLARSSFQG